MSGDLGEESVAITEMAIGRGGADARETRGLGQAEAESTMLFDELARRLEQNLLEVAMMI